MSTYLRCGCRDASSGKQLGAECPQLKTDRRRHGVRWLDVAVPTSTGVKRLRRAVGPAKDTTERDAKAQLQRVADLVGLGTDAATINRIGDLIMSADPLPEVADVRRRLGLRGELGVAATTGELLEEWFTAKQRGWRASTRKNYREKLDQHIVPAIGEIPAERLSAEHIAGIFDRIRAANDQALAAGNPARVVGVQSQHHVRAIIRAALNWAVRNRKLTFNPVLGVDLEPVPERAVTVWEAAQIRRFLAATATDRLATMWRMSLLLGLRRGEVLGLRWSSVDLDAEHPVLRVTDTVLQLSGRVVAGTPKTRAGERFVFLDPGTVDALRTHRTRQLVERQALQAYEDNDLVFAREDGSQLRPDRVSVLFRALAIRAGLPPIRLHDARHSAASLALAEGLDIKVVSSLLGHSTTAITQNLYTHVPPRIASDAVTRMATLIDLPKRKVEATEPDFTQPSRTGQSDEPSP